MENDARPLLFYNTHEIHCAVALSNTLTPVAKGKNDRICSRDMPPVSSTRKRKGGASAMFDLIFIVM